MVQNKFEMQMNVLKIVCLFICCLYDVFSFYQERWGQTWCYWHALPAQDLPNYNGLSILQTVLWDPGLSSPSLQQSLENAASNGLAIFWKSSHRKQRPGRPKTSWREVIQKDISKLDMRWTVEEAEVAAREQIMWRHLSSQVVYAAIYDANQ